MMNSEFEIFLKETGEVGKIFMDMVKKSAESQCFDEKNELMYLSV